MFPFLSQLAIDRSGSQPVYTQIAAALLTLIRDGSLKPGVRLPSTRDMAALLSVHRKTVVQAYDELLAQGWLEGFTGKGTFVSKNLPEIKTQIFSYASGGSEDPLKTAGFSFRDAPHLDRNVLRQTSRLHLDDGFPDPRLAPLEDISRAYRSQLLTGNSYARLGYSDTQGASWLRQELSLYLNQTRGLRTMPENILVTRGTMMGIYLVCRGLVERGMHVASADLAWSGAMLNFREAGAITHTLPVDAYGIDIDALETLCQTVPLRLLYVTSHHQYPTTVVLRADRRIRLLQLAEQYGFILFEDDYDYDFHYQSKPLLPLAGADRSGMTIYCGSFTKAISPAFRVGYLVAPANVVAHLARYRRIIDRQGDSMLENAIAELLHLGIIQKHLRKAVRIYKERRDVLCKLLADHVGDYCQFQIPEGGMAVWTQFAPDIDLKAVSAAAIQQDLFFAEGYGAHESPHLHNSTRLGFASSTTAELEESVGILAALLKKGT